MMPSDHLILCHPLILLPSIFPSIRVFSNESVLHTRWPKYCSFSISPSNEYSGLISLGIDLFDLLAVSLKSLLQRHSLKASVLWCSAFFMVHLSHPYMTTGKTIALTLQTFADKVMCRLDRQVHMSETKVPNGMKATPLSTAELRDRILWLLNVSETTVYFPKWMFYFGIVLDLQESCRVRAEFPSAPLTQRPLSLTSYITRVHLWKLRTWHWFMTTNYTPDSIWISPVFPLLSSSWSRFQSRAPCCSL